MLLRPDPTFYPSARLAMQAPPERLAYVTTFNANGNGRPDALLVVDVDPDSPAFGKPVGRVEMPNAGDELHHFGWNACSSALCPYAPHPHVERRYLIVPGLRSSRIHVIDIKPDPRQPKIIKVIDSDEVAGRSGYTRLHTIHCGPDDVYVSGLGSPSGDGPGGVLVLDHYSFDVLGRWEVNRHPRWAQWTGMRVGFRDLTLWSFLMASAHGAGLMLIPIILNLPHSDHLHHAHGAAWSPAAIHAGAHAGMGSFWMPVGIHTLGYLTLTGLVALVVYWKFGLAILRQAWFDLDFVWAAALVGTGILTLLL